MTTPAPEAVPEDLIRELRSAGRVRQDAVRRLGVARQEMYEVVDRAVAAGVTYQAIAEATGLTKGMIAGIVRRNDEAGG